MSHRVYTHPQAGQQLREAVGALQGVALGSGPLTQLTVTKARVDPYATGLFALSHLGQHHFLVGQPGVWKLQPSQASHCLGTLDRPTGLAIRLSTHLKQATETLPQASVSLQLGHLHAEFWPPTCISKWIACTDPINITCC